jgi:hypothetical protein
MQGNHLGAQNALLGEQASELHMGNNRQQRIIDLQRSIAEMEQGVSPQQDYVAPQQSYNPSPASLSNAMQNGINASGQQMSANQPQVAAQNPRTLSELNQLGAIPKPINNPREITGEQIQQSINDIIKQYPEQNQGRAIAPIGQKMNQQPIAAEPTALPQPQLSQLDRAKQELSMLQGLRTGGKDTLEAKEERAVSTTERKEDIKEYNKTINAANASGKAAHEVNKYLDKFENSYGKLGSAEKGVLAGRAPAVSSNAQQADLAAQNIQAGLMILFKGGRITEKQLEFLGRLKPNRTMNPPAAKAAMDSLRAYSTRFTEEQPFLNAARAKGLNSQDAKTLWNAYDTERPAYDEVNQKPLIKNLHSFKDYLSPEALNAVREGNQYSPKKGGMENIEDEKMFNGQRYVKINGEWHQS